MPTTTQNRKRRTTKPEAPEAQDSSLMPPTTDNNSVTPPQSTTDYNPGGSIEIPSFDASSLKPADLQTDSSGIGRTSAEDTQNILQSIKEKRNTVAIVRANIGLTSDLVRAATDYRKLEGLVIDYATEGINNQVRMVRQDVATVRLDKETIKLQGERHLVDQERIKTDGIGSLTPVIQDEWNTRKEIALARVEALKRSAENFRTTYEETRSALDV